MRAPIGHWVRMHRPPYTLTLLALCAFSLRALVPVGLMPAAAVDGWFLQLCPEGLSPAAMAVLSGDEHHQHHVGQAQPLATPVDCQLGGGVSATLEIADLSVALVELGGPRDVSLRVHATALRRWPLSTYPRAPPSHHI